MSGQAKPVSAQVAAGVTTSVSIVRWICVLPAACVAFYLSLYLAMFSWKFFNGWCPGGTISSGMCSVKWVSLAPFAFGGLLAPTLVIAFGTLMAPSHRPAVAWTLYLVGALVSFRFFRLPYALVPAGIAGALSATYFHWRAQCSRPS